MSHSIIDKIVNFFLKLKDEKFTGDIEIHFNQGGIQGIKKTRKEPIKL
jgi:hypothetical protein